MSTYPHKAIINFYSLFLVVKLLPKWRFLRRLLYFFLFWLSEGLIPPQAKYSSRAKSLAQIARAKVISQVCPLQHAYKNRSCKMIIVMVLELVLESLLETTFGFHRPKTVSVSVWSLCQKYVFCLTRKASSYSQSQKTCFSKKILVEFEPSIRVQNKTS